MAVHDDHLDTGELVSELSRYYRTLYGPTELADAMTAFAFSSLIYELDQRRREFALDSDRSGAFVDVWYRARAWS